MPNNRDAWTEAVTKGSLGAARMPQVKRSKYGAVKVTVDGITFHSKREAARYHELKLRQKAGQIRNLKLQVRYTLRVRADDAPVSFIVGDYIADFTYEERGKNSQNYPDVWSLIVEDVKGFRTPIYKLKKRMVEAQYGITIREI